MISRGSRERTGKVSTCLVEDARGGGREARAAWVDDQFSAGMGAEYAVDINELN